MKLNYRLADATENDIDMIIEAEKETLTLENRQKDVDIDAIKKSINKKEIKLVAIRDEIIGFFWIKLNHSISYYDNVFFVKLTYLKKAYRKFFYRFILEAIKDCAKEAGFDEIYGDVFHSNIDSFKVHSKLAEPVYTVFRAKI